jgi:hypothetical protein
MGPKLSGTRREDAYSSSPRDFAEVSALSAWPAAFRRFRFARSASASLLARRSAAEAGFWGFSGLFRDMIACLTPPLPNGRGFRYADAL